MIGNGLFRAPLARKQIWLTAIAGLTLGQLLAVSPAMAGVAKSPDAMVGTVSATPCGHGVSAVNVTLPAGFDPLRATNTELVGNDLPARPAGRAELAAWKRFVTGRVAASRSRCAVTAVPAGVVPQSIIGDGGMMRASSIIGDAGVATNVSIIGDASVIGDASIIGDVSIIGDASTGNSSIIGDRTNGRSSIIGDASTGRSSIIGDSMPIGGASIIGDASVGAAVSGSAAAAVSLNEAYGTWRVTRPARGTFAGLALGRGTSAAQPLIQAGSASVRGTAGARPRYSLWWRVVPRQAARQRISLQVHRGDTVYAHIRLVHGQALVTVRDESTGAGGTYLLALSRLG